MPAKKPNRAIKLFGTVVPDSKGRLLRAGPLSAALDNGALRYVRLNDVEVLRAIAFLVRDENWGTFSPEISKLAVKQGKGGFEVSYEARCADPKRALTYKAHITATADGALRFDATALPHTDFLTNRTGFVVLHPLKGVAGCPVEILHVDGRKVKDEFPAIVNPVQPFYDIRALSHEAVSGVWATCRMEGDTFEMEDHRNWTDASFKTYVRPLALPWPYTLPAGSEIKQSVSLSFAGKLPKPKAAAGSKAVAVDIGRAGNLGLPKIGLGVGTDEADAATAVAELIKAAEPQILVCQVDGRQGNGLSVLRRYRRLADATGADVVLEIVLPGQQAPEIELQRISRDVNDSGVVPAAIAVSPAADLKGVLPGSRGPRVPELADIYRAARAAFPGIPLGGGMFSFFTELNRKRPPAELLDFVTHTTCPIVHAADDISVMETLEALPYVIQSTRAFIGRTPYRVGPSAIPARDNPYGAAAAPNPNNQRVCLAKMDPRQRGLFAAAWTLGYAAAFAYGGIEVVTMGAPTGPAGIIYRRTDYPQPYFDDLKGPAVYPAYHVVAGLGRALGHKLMAVKSGDPAKVASLAYRDSKGPVLWLANLTGEEQAVKIGGLGKAAMALHLLDEDSFQAATTDPAWLEKPGKKMRSASSVKLGPYAVARLSPARK
jgi:hypothetical protein